MADKVKILHVIDSDGMGGAQDLLVGLCKNMDKTKFHVDVCLLLSYGKKYAQRFTDVADHVFVVTSCRAGAIRCLSFPNQIVCKPYDIVHSHLLIGFLWANLWLPALGKKLISSINHTADQVAFYYFPLYRFAARSTTVYFALNRTVERDLLRGRVRKERIYWQPLGIDGEAFKNPQGEVAARDKFKIRPEDVLILRVARLERDKKHDLFLKAMMKVKESMPRAVLFIAGEGSQKAILDDLVRKWGLSENVIFGGECRDYLPVLNGIAKIAWALGWGSAVTENMFCGLPVVSFDEVGADEIIEDGVNGYIVPRNETSLFAQKTVELLNNDHKRSLMGARARQTVTDRFTFKRVTKSYEQFYESLILQPTISK